MASVDEKSRPAGRDPGLERILVVDDSVETLELIYRNLTPEGYRVLTVSGVEEAIRILGEMPIDLVITDLKMPRVSGLDLVRHVRENMKDTEVMMITGYASIEGAVTAVKLGAEEYLAKPFTKEELLSAVSRAIGALRARRAAAASVLPAAFGLIGESDAIRRVFDAIERARGSDRPVLITGENGTGKQSVARVLHDGSRRANSPFVIVNCAGVPPERIETELFGYGDVHPGFVQLARGGTLFLGRIDRMPMTTQARLAAALAEPADFRPIAASSRDLAGLVKRGVWRQDLLDVFADETIPLPPLRERGDDVILLTRHFTALAARELGRPAPRYSERAMQALREYHWPGNVSELENVLQRLTASTEGGLIEGPDLPALMRFSALRGSGYPRSLREAEVEHIRNVLAGVGGNKTKAAEILGIDRKTLREKLRGLD